MIIDGLIAVVTPQEVIVETELGELVTLPRYFGETPPVGAAVRLDFSSGAPKIYSTPPITKIEKVDRFLNFYAMPGEGIPVEVDSRAGEAKMRDKVAKYGPFVPYSFMDTPIGARTTVADNGNMSFTGPTAVGMATGCGNKVIVRHKGQMEVVTKHFVALQGRTVIVSSFEQNLSIEIDILRAPVETKIDFKKIKNEIAKEMLGKEESIDPKTEKPVPAVDPKTYEDAFDLLTKGAESFSHPAFVKMFGLHLAEILCSVEWERVRFRGDEKTFIETFDGIADFSGYEGYCTDCYNSGKIRELEFFLTREESTKVPASLNIPRCENQVADRIYEMSATINDTQYSVSALNIVTSDGTRIEYVSQKREYSFSHALVAKKSFVAADQQGVFSNRLHVDVDKISFSNLSFDNGVPDFCGNDTELPVIYWNGDFLLSVSGSLTMGAEGALTIASSVQSILAGGTRGIKIDSSGSTAITF